MTALVAVDDLAVDRNLLAGSDDDDVADLTSSTEDLLGAVAEDRRFVGREVHQFAQASPRAVHRVPLEQFRDAEEERQRRGLEVQRLAEGQTGGERARMASTSAGRCQDAVLQGVVAATQDFLAAGVCYEKQDIGDGPAEPDAAALRVAPRNAESGSSPRTRRAHVYSALELVQSEPLSTGCLVPVSSSPVVSATS